MNEARVSVEERVRRANVLLTTIATHGRHFFGHKGAVSQLERDQRGRIWFVDSYSQRRIYTHTNHRWRGFTNGGTLRLLIMELRQYISQGTPLSKHRFGPWPTWVCDGDLWGYGKDMDTVRTTAHALGMLPTEEE